MMNIVNSVVIISLFVTSLDSHLLSVYWGQDAAGGLGLTIEKNLGDYCENFEYDVITLAFLDIFFDYVNNGTLPGINLANHCNTTFKGEPDLLNCTDIGQQIKQCQQKGKQIVLSLGGAAGSYGFVSASQATIFAVTIWNLFLGGRSKYRPFSDAVLDGVDLDIEGGSPLFYSDFVRSIRQYMDMDYDKRYLITGAPQCPYPDAYMGPGTDGTVLHDVAQEFDYLYVQFYNNYCYLGAEIQFNKSIDEWFGFVEGVRQTHGKAPLVFIGLPSHPRASSDTRYYQTPAQVKAVYEKIKSNTSLGGIMLWDAGFDSNNVIGGQYYSTLLNQFMLKQPPPDIVICTIGSVTIVNIPIVIIFICTMLVSLCALVKFVQIRVKRKSLEEKVVFI